MRKPITLEALGDMLENVDEENKELRKWANDREGQLELIKLRELQDRRISKHINKKIEFKDTRFVPIN